MNVTQSLVSNVKKRSKIIKAKFDIKHAQALELASQEAGFPNYHALNTRVKKLNNHESNIVNANKGMEGTNREYSLAQGNKGKQLNPNQKSSLLVVFNDDLVINKFKLVDGKYKIIELDFQTDYLDKGFAKDIGARLLSFLELKQRSLDLTDGGKLHQWGYTCIEFIRNKDNPWTIEEANEFVIKRMSDTLGSQYREFFFIDDVYISNHLNEEMIASIALDDDIPYCPAIDGY